MDLDELYKNHKITVKHAVSKWYKIATQEDKEDLEQEIWLNICKKYKYFNHKKSSIKTWIYSVSRSTIIDIARKYSSDKREIINRSISYEDWEIERSKTND